MTSLPKKQENNILLLRIFLICLIASQGQAQTWSLRYLARASNFILVAHDQALSQKENLCGLSSAQAEKLSQNLKMLIDEKIKNTSALSQARIFRQASNCELECTCDIFSLYFETLDTTFTKNLVSQTDTKASQMTSQNRLTCAQKFKEFCKSQLLQKIR